MTPLSFTTEELSRAISQLPPMARLELENILLKNRLEQWETDARTAKACE